jgi:replicative DNA helicase
VLTNRPCYRMTIEGAEVIADARHKWVTSTRDERGYVGRDGYPKERYEQVRTTEDVAKDLKCNGLWPSTNHAIRAVSITGSGSDNLPVPAYTLGYWLGDGSSRSAHITSHPEDQPFIVERIAEDGYETRLSLGQDRRGYTFLVKRLSRDLRAANVIKNKRIPARSARHGRPGAASRMGAVEEEVDVAQRGDRTRLLRRRAGPSAWPTAFCGMGG